MGREMKKKVKNIFSKIIIILILTSFYLKLSGERNKLKKSVKLEKNLRVPIFFCGKNSCIFSKNLLKQINNLNKFTKNLFIF